MLLLLLCDNLASIQQYALCRVATGCLANADVDCFVRRSSTTSARSDVYVSVEEFGRTYHGYKAGSKQLPGHDHEIFMVLAISRRRCSG